MNFKYISKLSLLILIGSITLLYYSCSLFFNQTGDELLIEEKDHIRVMFYNVENLFDIADDTLVNDDEFLPDGDYHWNYYRYNDKLQKIAKVILAVGSWGSTDLIGLCEIENRGVLEDLITKTPLNSFSYGIIHKESPDSRGIDVALLYNKGNFSPLFYDFYKILFPDDPGSLTREILYAKGVVKKEDTLHIFINHWPSRRGGKEESEDKRVFVARILKSKVDSILTINPHSNILIMGDFNDEPGDKSINETLGAAYDSIDASRFKLYNLSTPLKLSGNGSYKYGYEWNQLDQIIVSSGLLDVNSILYTNLSGAQIFKADWLMIEDEKYTGLKPARTYLGPRYMGGYSDHLPVYLDIYISK